jgi:hypothetical protein
MVVTKKSYLQTIRRHKIVHLVILSEIQFYTNFRINKQMNKTSVKLKKIKILNNQPNLNWIKIPFSFLIKIILREGSY